MTSEAPELYDAIASCYHLVYDDWEASIAFQAEQLDGLMADVLGPGPHSILDLSCGIGTQALGLAAQGHRVAARDLSKASVDRCAREAADRGLAIETAVGDMAHCHDELGRQFDVVLAADNAVPHLLGDAAIRDAFRQFRACTRPGGLTLITVRDYEQESKDPRQLRPFGVRETDEGRTLVFQTWDFGGSDSGKEAGGADVYDLTMYFLHERHDGKRELAVGRSRYYAIGTAKLVSLFEEVGFEAVERLDGRFFQPVIRARRSGDSRGCR